MKKILLPLFLIGLLLTPTSCFFESEPTPEQVKLGKELVTAQSEIADVVKIGINLKKQLDNDEISKGEFFEKIAENEKDVTEAISAMFKVKDAIAKTKESGSSMWGTVKTVGITILGRSLLHGAQIALAGSSGGGGILSMLLSLILGGSGSKKGKQQIIQEDGRRPPVEV